VQYYSGVKANMNLYHQYKDFSDDSDDEEDSMFGSFNPNLNTKENSYGRKQSSLAKPASADYLSKVTLRTGSYMGLCLLDKGAEDINQSKTANVTNG